MLAGSIPLHPPGNGSLHGASLVQLYTGWIFEGPELVPQILEGILSQLDRHGFRDVSEAVGSGVPWQ